MKTYLDCWTSVATDLFSQALAGEPQLVESLPKPLAAGSFGFAATLARRARGRFAVVLDGSILESPLVGEGDGPESRLGRALREVAECRGRRAAGQDRQEVPRREVRADRRRKQGLRAFQLKSGDRAWTILVRDEVRAAQAGDSSRRPQAAGRAPAASPRVQLRAAPRQALSPGIELLLDVELEASLRFGCREMPLGEILDLGPGDVVQLDRHVSDPVDLIVGDKIVARGEVVLVNGNFGLRVTEVAAPRKRLESIRCLF